MSSSSSFASRLAQAAPIVLDGGLATALETRGHNLNHALWSARLLREDPKAIQDVHRDYFLSGADVAITASYQASTAGLREHLQLSAEEAAEVVKESVRLAANARDEVLAKHKDRSLFVAGSVGPYGAYLAHGEEYTGDYGRVSIAQLKTFHRERVRALLEAGSDVLACETVPSLDETRALCELLAEEFPTCQAWLSWTIKDGKHISDGTPLEKIAVLVNGCEQVVAVGFNCIPLASSAEAMKNLAKLTSKPLVIYPNSGEIWDAIRKEWYGGAAATEQLQTLTAEWYKTGAKLIGGCCRMGFDDVKTIDAVCKKLA